MPDLNGLDYLRSGVYLSQTKFSRLSKFLGRFQERFSRLPFDKEVIEEQMRIEIARASEITAPKSPEEALTLLLAGDLKRIALTIGESRLAMEGGAELSSSLERCCIDCCEVLRDLGLSIAQPELYFVDRFPAPYDHAAFFALTADEADETKYGIPKGIYFLESGLRPIYSKFLLAHEIVHTVVGSRSPEYLGRGLEEGLAEIVGGLYTGSRILGKNLTRNLFYYNRLGYGIEQFWQLYLDYTRMGGFLYMKFGLDGLLHLVKSGRKAIKAVEVLCFLGKYDSIELPQGQWDADLTDLVAFTSMTFSRDLVVSPLAFLIAEQMQEGDTVDRLSERTGIDRRLVSEALDELQNRVFVAVINKETVDYSDAKMLLSCNAMRYEIP